MANDRTAFDMLGIPPYLGDIETLGDPAVQVPQHEVERIREQEGQKYHELQYRNKDDCHLGCANGVPGGDTILAGTAKVFEGVPTSPFKPKAMVLASYAQVNLFVQAVTIGPFNAIEGDMIPAAAHSEVSLTQFVSWPMIQANSPIRITLYNADPSDKPNISVDIRGIRFRP